MVKEQESEQRDGLKELSDEHEDELCKLWDMAMDKVCLISLSSTCYTVCCTVEYSV